MSNKLENASFLNKKQVTCEGMHYEYRGRAKK